MTDRRIIFSGFVGFHKEITHLDGHDLTVSRQTVTQPGFVEVIEGEGMPRHQALGYGTYL
ncbi:hypothetical protein KEM48_013683 [Puccinia striiformis f. sp. tritici PST-130]|nr:hypothetical protein KEM48_013683 [Puccinia striiformis f. sp. tritici PST-130]